MSSQAYVLIKGAAGSVPAIQRSVSEMDGVKSCMAVTGQFDLVALVEGETHNDLGLLGLNRIQRLAGVLRTVTCNVIEI